MRRHAVAILSIFFCATAACQAAPYGSIAPPAGPYAPAAGQPGSTAISYDSPLFNEWANGYTDLTRGPEDIANPTGPAASYGQPTDALGQAQPTTTTHVVSLGDGGSMTLTFAQPIANGPGADFAVFENGYNDNFLELAFVEVSSDGTNFFRFPAVSLMQTTTQQGAFDGTMQATDFYDLAGKYRTGFGTPFDLAELRGVQGLNVNDVRYVRVVDVVGRVTPVSGGMGNIGWSPSTDYYGNIINDPYPTDFSTGGFDLNGVGVINESPEPTAAGALAIISICFASRRFGRRGRRVNL